MTIIERVQAAGLPPHEYVVIGSGILDAFGLRRSGDIDLVVSDAVFLRLRQDSRYVCEQTERGEVMTCGDFEIWRDWGSDETGVLGFSRLWDGGVTIDGVRFCSPQVVIAKKRQRGWEKDRRDIALLEGYLATHTDTI